ncbi:MAG TPA: M48 family metallopeptidase [Gemmatimonadaceae bacterium]|nr:M48 family metallopeptidase [Gemmatimonadaceae bacterium]
MWVRGTPNHAAGGFVLGVAMALGLGACSVSQQQEVQIGQEQSAQIKQQLPLVQDAAINQYVTSLGNQIASHTSRADLQWQFYVVNTDAVNAFALPGGIIYINRGVLERADRMDELAGVMGHEIEHVVRRHSVKQMEQMQGANVGVALACTLTNVCNNGAAAAAINVGGSAIFAKFSRTDEQQADEGGFRNVMNAGISPEGMLSFFQKLLAEEQQSGGNSNVSSWFATHPGTQDRIDDIQRMLAQVPQSQLRSLTTDTPAFRQMKQRVMALPPAPKQSTAR